MSQVRERPAPSNRGRPAPPAGRGARSPVRPLRPVDGRAPTRGPRRLRDGGPDNRRRGVALLLVLVLLMGVAGWRLVDLQVLSGPDLAARGLDQRVRTVELTAERGLIFDRNFTELAMSVPRHTVWANPQEVTDAQGLANVLAPVLGRSAEALYAQLSKPEAQFVYLARQVEDDVAAAVADLDPAGVYTVPESRRYYPGGEVGASVVGLAGLDGDGLEGIELQYDDLLTGTPGMLTMERDPQGRAIPQGESAYVPPVRGGDVVLTLDQDLQFEAERLLAEQVDAIGGRSGIAIVVDVQTGDILAMATVLAPEPEDAEGSGTGDASGAGAAASGGASAGSAAVIEGAAPATPSERNRAVTDNYEPGSTLKVVTMAAALEDGTTDWERRWTVPYSTTAYDRTVRDAFTHDEAWWTMGDIVRRSSNVGTVQIAQRVGEESIDHWLRAFGLGQPTGVDFPGEASGQMLDLEDWSGVTEINVPIGQGISVTPLQLLSIYQTIANGGVRVQPRLVQATIDGGEYQATPVTELGRVISPETADALNMMLRGVVQCDGGTGRPGGIADYTTAGKTGTAQVPVPGGYSDHQYRSSFVGFVPAQAPELAAIVVLDSDKPSIGGGAIAGPVFSELMQYALRDGNVVPPTLDPIAQRTGPVPSEEVGPDCRALGGAELGTTREAPGQAPLSELTDVVDATDPVGG